MNSATPSRPTANDDLVSWNNCQGNATKLIIEPKKETDWAIKRSRYSRESRNGVISTANTRQDVLAGSVVADCSTLTAGSGVRFGSADFGCSGTAVFHCTLVGSTTVTSL